MPDLPSVDTITTGGVIAAVLGATTWLIRWFAGLATHGEDLADRRIAALTADFEAYRVRTQAELEGVHAELAQLREAQRVCLAESAAQAAQLAALRAELARLKRT